MIELYTLANLLWVAGGFLAASAVHQRLTTAAGWDGSLGAGYRMTWDLAAVASMAVVLAATGLLLALHGPEAPDRPPVIEPPPVYYVPIA